MYVAFDQLPATARVWIYQASRPLTSTETIGTLPALARFAEEWTSHGRNLLASAEVLHQHFLVLGLDEAVAGASGCSIDASVRFVAQLEQHLGLELLEKSRLAFLQHGQVQLLDRRMLKDAVASGAITPETLYFDNTLATKGALNQHWPCPAGTTWLARYFGPVVQTPALT
ncbi:hypothetical protein [Hymenobacter sp. UYCo722]|uniref:hypothetical protein n=1 Tax=Hymenobacter sp. UYCo722 TaxID=3156335 RepID=UPI003396D2E8